MIWIEGTAKRFKAGYNHFGRHPGKVLAFFAKQASVIRGANGWPALTKRAAALKRTATLKRLQRPQPGVAALLPFEDQKMLAGKEVVLLGEAVAGGFEFGADGFERSGMAGPAGDGSFALEFDNDEAASPDQTRTMSVA